MEQDESSILRQSLKESQAKLAAAEELIKDIAEHGFRADTTPARETTPEGHAESLWWHKYLKDVDEMLRSRAREVLNKIRA